MLNYLHNSAFFIYSFTMKSQNRINKFILHNPEDFILHISNDCEQKTKLLEALLNKIVGHKNWHIQIEKNKKTLNFRSYRFMNNFLLKEVNKLGISCKIIYRK